MGGNARQEPEKVQRTEEALEETWVRDNPYASCEASGNTLLHAAVRMDEVKLVNVLCTHFLVALDMKNVQGNTALHLSAQLIHGNITEILLKHGSQAMETANQEGLNPLQMAALHFNLGSLEGQLLGI